ncbi:MAG: hypothetical protein WD883_00170 [Candidatus Colwellbacteria bacterium]
MPRAIKHLLYGLLYLSILGLIAFPFVYPRLQTVASCSDGIQNQNEEGIDCGGDCEHCGLIDLEVEVGTIEVLEVANRTTIALQIQNPSGEFGLGRTTYSLKVLNRLGQLLISTEGVFSLMPLERKYLVQAGLDIERGELGEVMFELGETSFVLLDDLPQYDVSIEGVTTTFLDDELQVTGIIVNEGSFGIREVQLATTLYTADGVLINAGTTLVNSIGAFGRKDFVIRLPKGGAFVDLDKTTVYTTIITR